MAAVDGPTDFFLLIRPTVLPPVLGSSD